MFLNSIIQKVYSPRCETLPKPHQHHLQTLDRPRLQRTHPLSMPKQSASNPHLHTSIECREIPIAIWGTHLHHFTCYSRNCLKSLALIFPESSFVARYAKRGLRSGNPGSIVIPAQRTSHMSNIVLNANDKQTHREFVNSVQQLASP